MSYDEQRISDQIDGGLYHKNQQEMTQETTKEQIPKWIEDYYKADYKSSAGKAVKYLYEQLSAEREAHKKEIERILSAVARGENLANSLNFDGKSELDKERERAGKLLEALRTISNHSPEWDHISGEYTSQIIAQQTINEYDNETKES